MSIVGRLFGGGVDSVDATAARSLVDEGATMLDVRERHEWNAGHAPWAVHVPLSQLDRKTSRVPRGRRVVVVCASGSRSRRACRMLASQGYDVVNLRGGMHAWARSGQPVVDRSGRRATG